MKYLSKREEKLISSASKKFIKQEYKALTNKIGDVELQISFGIMSTEYFKNRNLGFSDEHGFNEQYLQIKEGFFEIDLVKTVLPNSETLRTQSFLIHLQ